MTSRPANLAMLRSPKPATKSVAAGVRDKIKTVDELAVTVAEWRRKGETVVLAHGTFDLLHMGHVRHLEQARREGTRLIVTVTGAELSVPSFAA